MACSSECQNCISSKVGEEEMYLYICLCFKDENNDDDTQGAAVIHDYEFRVGAETHHWQWQYDKANGKMQIRKLNPGAVSLKHIQVEVLTPEDATEEEGAMAGNAAVPYAEKSLIFEHLKPVMFPNLIQPGSMFSEIRCSFLLSLPSFAVMKDLPCSRLLKTIYQTKESNDLEICTLDNVILAHKAVIGTLSPLLHTRIEHCGMVSQTVQIDMMDFDDVVEESVVKYAYGTLTVPEVEKNAVKLMRAAHKYGLKDLVCLCEIFMMDLSVENIVKICAASFHCQRKDLFLRCCKFIRENYPAIVSQKLWDSDIQKNPPLFQAVMDGIMDPSLVSVDSSDAMLYMTPPDTELEFTVRMCPEKVSMQLCKYYEPTDIVDQTSFRHLIPVTAQITTLHPFMKELACYVFTILYEERLYADCSIRTKSRLVPAHKFMLKHYSDIFSDMLSKSNYIDFTGMSQQFSEIILDILYAYRTNHNTDSFMEQILNVGEKLNVLPLLGFYCDQMKSSLTCENACRLFCLAFKGNSVLLEEATYFIRKNYFDVKKEKDFVNVLAQDPEALLYLFDNVCSTVCEIENRILPDDKDGDVKNVSGDEAASNAEGRRFDNDDGRCIYCHDVMPGPTTHRHCTGRNGCGRVVGDDRICRDCPGRNAGDVVCDMRMYCSVEA